MVIEIKMRNESRKETERCKREVLHEAEVINSLGDHPNLPFLFGVCTEKELISLLLQFYETGDRSLTLSKAVKIRLFKTNEIVRVFQDIVICLENIHNKGFLHYDLKGNNVLIQKKGEEFHPIIIHFKIQLGGGAQFF